MTTRYRMYEDNAGGLHLAVLDQHGRCIYYVADLDRQLILETRDAARDGGDPIADDWEGGELDPQECYDWADATLDLIEEG